MQAQNFDLVRDARAKTMLAAHRGVCGGNIPCNTIASFDAALCDGADMVELDVGRSADGTLYCFHEGNEIPHLGLVRPFHDLTDAEVRVLRYLNTDCVPTEHPVYPLEEIFRHLKGRCYINVDKFALYTGPISEMVRHCGIQDQVVVKTAGTPELLRRVEELAPDLNYIAILEEKDNFTEEALKRPIRYIGAETVFASESAPICQPEYIERMHDAGLVLWGNAIVFNYKRVLSAGHNDDISIAGNPEAGWGWLKDHGYDIIQTDWPCQMRLFYEKTGRL